MASTTSARFALLLIVSTTPLIEANDFLGRHQAAPSYVAPDPEFQRILLEQLEVALGSEHRAFTKKRLQDIEKDLTPMFKAMPKTAEGKLEDAAINYMLHRAFVHRHGWFVRSLSGEGKTMSMWNSSSAASLLQDKVPNRVIGAFNNHTGSGGTGMYEVAVLAATLEHLAHQEALDRLRTAYQAFDFSFDDVVSPDEADSIIQAYMAIYILGGYLAAMSNTTSIEPFKVRRLLQHIDHVYPTWPQTVSFALEVKQRVAPKRDYLYFADLANVLEQFGENFGSFQDKECLSMKDQLIKAEQPGSPGRVRLADFYMLSKQSDDGLYSESLTYLRELGALDESDPANPRVLMANYVNGPSNCIASSNFYSVCCRDECEELVSHLEGKLQRPDAKPAQLVAMVAALPSRTEPANRTLSPWLLDRLDEVAAHHGGSVPLHGRLFAQWMHYAYPRECAYPHIAGIFQAQRIEQYLSGPNVKESIDNIVASSEEMQMHIEQGNSGNITDGTDASMWVLEEELLVEPSLAAYQHRSLDLRSFRGMAFVVAAVAATMGLVRNLDQVIDRKLFAQSTGNEKYTV